MKEIQLVFLLLTSLASFAAELPAYNELIDKTPYKGTYVGKKSIDAVVNKAMNAFPVPGMAVGIVYRGKLVHLEGYGIREYKKPEKVDAATLFKIASNSKAFTTAALSMLVDQGKLKWTTPVKDIIPEFKLADPWLTEHLSVADLLTHRSGLNKGAGDLMLWPEPNHFNRLDVVYALRFFESTKLFRAEYAYDNLLYIVAGELIPRITGKLWSEYIDEKIMSPLGLNHCFAGALSQVARSNTVAPHSVIDGELTIVERGRINDNISLMAAAGGIRCSVKDMTVWMLTQLNKGISPGGVRLYSEKQAEEMWHPQIIRTVSKKEMARDNTHFKAYGLGWRLADVHGYKQVSHTGSLAGSRSFVTLIPELDLGVVVLTNGASDSARRSVMYSIVRSYMDTKPVDWVNLFLDDKKAKQSKSSQIDKEKPPVQYSSRQEIRDYLGAYLDPWFGQIDLQEKEGKYLYKSIKSPQLEGELYFVKRDMLSVQWFDRTLEADAYLYFQRNSGGEITKMTMEAISEDTDFSFDFPDLKFSKIVD